ncbi:MAG: HNH endonuclease signature motif containing protein [Candidatus Firestonebacteria bacterium]
MAKHNKMKITNQNIKYNKIWLSKDKYIFRFGYGNHWFIKKFVVLYKIFLVERKKINKETLKEITDIFNKFIDSIEDKKIKKDAEEYFFSPLDFRKSDNIIDFDKFNDVPNLDDSARKYYFLYLTGIGMQSGIKKRIGNLLYSDRNITISKIIKKIPKIQKEEIEKKKKQDKEPRSVKDNTRTIFSDFHAEIRNFRQLLTYFGILPPEEDGYEMNEIGNLIYFADSILIMAIWEHQKIKMRYYNPYTSRINPLNVEDNYKTKKDFSDFSVNPYIALINIIEKLNSINQDQAYLSFEDYKFFICREAPSDLDRVIKKILDYRNLKEDEKNKIKEIFNNRPKTRKFSINKTKASTDDFLKEISNLLYGLYEYKYTKGNPYYPNTVRYSKGIFKVNNISDFIKHSKFIKEIEIYLKCYDKFYKILSAASTLNLIHSAFEKSTEEHKKILLKIKSEYIDDFRKEDIKLKNIFQKWKRYISFIDWKLLVFCYVHILSLYKRKLYLSGPLIDITGVDQEELKSLLLMFENCINKGEYNLNEKIQSSRFLDTDEEEDKIERWLKIELKTSNYSTIKEQIKNEENDIKYNIVDGQRERKRNLRMMKLVQYERFHKHLIIDLIRKDYPVNKCDSCDKEFSGNEPECHHIIPFEIYGPDSPYNYAFLCKSCHKIFTHKTSKNERNKLIKNLKFKGIVNIDNFRKLIKEGEIRKEHLDVLLDEGFIHIVSYLDLLKMLKTSKLQYDKLDSIISKVGPSRNRWNRAMQTTFWFKEPASCESCKAKFKSNEPECHHIIYNSIKGPESPDNYTYLCRPCHDSITYNRQDKGEIIKNLVKNKIIDKESIENLILNNEILFEHLDFLLKEGFISEETYNRLRKIFKDKEKFNQ